MPASALERLATCYPGAVDPDEELVRALRFLGWPCDAATLLRAGYVGAAVAGAVTAACALVAGRAALAPPVGAAVGAAVALVVRRGPLALAALRRTRALGAATGLLGSVVLRMRLDPTPERAARFAARLGDGPLADALESRVAAARGTPRSGLGAFADAWTDWFPALDRSVALVLTAADAPPGRRDRALDRALSAVDADLRDRAASFAGGIRGPLTGLYAFGVLLPLALVGALPAAAAAGVPVTAGAFVAVYDLLLPAVVAAVGARVLLARPVAFPPPRVTRAHPDVPDSHVRSVGVGLAAGVAGWLLAGRLVAGWAAPVAAVGCGVGAALVVGSRPVVAVRERVRAVEAELPDALALVGRRVAEGEAVETAVARAGEDLPGPAGDAFAEATRRRRALRIGVRRAFRGDHGPFADAASPRLRGAAALLAVAAREGRPAGDALLGHAERLNALRDHERAARRELASVTETLTNTAALFGPLVGGATVALAGRLAAAAGGRSGELSAGGGGGTGAFGGGASVLPPGVLGPAVGAYVLLLAVLLTALATGVERGLDRALLARRVGIALLAATGSFLAGVVGAGLLL